MKFSTHSFEDVIFSVGTWNGYTVSAQTLKNLKNNFDSLKSKFKVPLKLGHNESQKVTDGQPALGWVDSLRLDNDSNPTKLYATYTDMPSIVFNAIKKKLYRSRSIEIEDQLRDGKKVNTVLTAVALLGSELPAVESLDDLGKYLASKDYDKNDLKKYKIDCSRDTSITHSNQLSFKIDINKEGSVMTPEEEAKLRDELTKSKLENASLVKDKADLESTNAKFSKDNADREEETKKALITEKRTGIKALLEIAVKDEVITPAQRETFSKLLGVDDDVKVIAIELDSVKELIGDSKTTMFSKKETASGQGSGGNENESPDDILTAKTFAHMEKHGVDDFEKAMFAVMKSDKKLSVEYMVSNGEYE